jgi:light-regulated signal transduction histidine kinase (bacteriophytochrome)
MSVESMEGLRGERDQLSRELANRSAQLEAVSREFEQFTQTLSHDLRAPLRALEGFAQILMEDYGDKLDEDGKKCVETIGIGARKASALVEDLSAFSRLCRQPFQPGVVNMRQVFEQKAQELKGEGYPGKFQIGALPEAWGDLALLDSIVNELLRNAVKFTKRQAQPNIEITGKSEKGAMVYAVRDNGVGFEPKYAGRLFGIFQRLHDDKDFEGRGIGLATVQRLINRHGGKVWAEAKPNAGATFFFSLPPQPL